MTEEAGTLEATQSSYTRCPGCSTVFRVTAAQLALREGQVRCGHCRAVFDANDHFVSLNAGPPPDEFDPSDELMLSRSAQRTDDAGMPRSPTRETATEETPTKEGVLQTSATEGAATDEAALETSAAEEAATEEAAFETPSTEKTATIEETATQEAITQDTATRETTTQETATEETATTEEAAKTEEAAAEVAAVGKQAIEETTAWETGVEESRTDAAAKEPVVNASDEAADATAIETRALADPTAADGEDGMVAEVADRGAHALDDTRLGSADASGGDIGSAAGDIGSAAGDTDTATGGIDAVAADTDDSGARTVEKDAGADEASIGAATPLVPADLGGAQRFEWKKRAHADSSRRVYASMTVLLVAGLALQATFEYRDALAARVPAMRPLLEGACSLLNCSVEPLRDGAALSIDASDLQADPAHRGLLVLSATVRNRAAHPIAYPYLELTLTDSSDRIVARRAFAPTEYAGGTVDLHRGIAPNGERLVRLFLDASATQQAGYRLYLFYP